MEKYENLNEKNCIRTHTGIYFNVFEPTLEMIDIKDIAHALSMIPRFGGHFPLPYSVAQHSVSVANLLDRKNAFTGLMHDASEAYLLDIPAPIKHNIPEYQKAEIKIMQLIAKKYKFQFPFINEIHEVDKKLLKSEWNFFVNYNKQDKSYFKCWKQEYAEKRFLHEFYKLQEIPIYLTKKKSMINHNPLGLAPGDEVILDEKFRNGSIVIIESITLMGLFSNIYSKEVFERDNRKSTWEVMTNRLTKIKSE